MKKYLAVFLGALLILSFAVTAFAEDKPEITLGGKILVRGWYFDNVSNTRALPIHPGDFESQSFYSTNVNLIVDAKITDNLRGLIELETASGGSANSGLWYWGDAGRGYDSKPNADILIRQAWIQYTGSGLLGTPSGIKVGHMPISLGEKIFLNNERFGDDAILLWVDPTKELHLAAGLVKLSEGNLNRHYDDVDGYVLIGTYMWDKDNTLGANLLWAHSDGTCPSNGLDVINVDDLNFYNVGIHGNGKIAGLSYAAEVDFQFGKIEALADSEDVDLKPKGWAALVKLGYMLDPVNLRASFAYGSGDNDATDGDCKEFQTLLGPDYGPTARLVHYTQIYERTVRTAAFEAALTTKLGGNTSNTGIANTTYYNLGLDINPTKELGISLDGFILRASKTGAWEDYVGQSVSKEIGWEIDSKLTYKIAKNLTYFIEAGVFDTGDFYKDAFGDDAKTILQAVHGLALTF